MRSDQLRKLQLTELEILSIIDEFCEKKNIRYSLFAGTALGAVRHGGFIPWDDDVDICMERKEYDRFIELWTKEGVPGYFLQSTKDESITISHSKIRKDNTVLASKDEYKQKGHHGIWVDIFPFDKLPRNKVLKVYILLMSMLCLIYTRDYPFKGKGKFLEHISKVLLMFPKSIKKKIKLKCKKEVTRYKDIDNKYSWFCASAPFLLNKIYPEDMLREITIISFENKKFRIASDYHTMLRVLYEDYNQLPPKEERVCKHNPEILIFDE